MRIWVREAREAPAFEESIAREARWMDWGIAPKPDGSAATDGRECVVLVISPNDTIEDVLHQVLLARKPKALAS